jgi:phosphoglycerate-specific signal transduction histidine kinase
MALGVQDGGGMSTSLPALSATVTEHGVVSALCHELHGPLEQLVKSLELAQRALAGPHAARDGQAGLRAARSLADARAVARHLERVIAELSAHAGGAPQTRRLDLRSVVRGAAAMAQSGDDGRAAIVVDADAPAWVLGVDTRLVHVFVELFAEALATAPEIAVRVSSAAGEVTVEVLRAASSVGRPHGSSGGFSQPLRRAVMRHIVAAHGGRLDDAGGTPLLARVVLPAAPASALAALAR